MGAFKEFDIFMTEQELDAELIELDRQLFLLDGEVSSIVAEAERMIERIHVQRMAEKDEFQLKLEHIRSQAYGGQSRTFSGHDNNFGVGV